VFQGHALFKGQAIYLVPGGAFQECPIGEPTRARKGQRDNAVLTIAAYIDRNAVRAGIVQDPNAYRYCGYGEACGGGEEARAKGSYR
jgi:hypothetical protein